MAEDVGLSVVVTDHDAASATRVDCRPVELI
jgi:hypothetical protein